MHLFARRIQTALACALLAGAAVSRQGSDAAIADDIAFARGLASEGLVEMAEQVLARAESRGGSARMLEELGRARCDIQAEGARRHPDPAERDRLLFSAIASYEAFVRQHPASASKDEAEAALVGTACTLARSLAQRLEDKTGEEHTQLSEQLHATLLGALSRTGGLVGALEALPEKSDAEWQRYAELLLDRGRMLLLLAETQVEQEPLFELARATFEKCAKELGEDSPFGLRAYVGIGDVHMARRQWSDAADFYGFVTEFAIPSDDAAWRAAAQGMTPEEQQRRFLFMQLGTPGLLEALSSAGNLTQACEQGLRLYNVLQRERLLLVPPYGDLGLLGLARALMDAGGFVGGPDGDLAWYATREELDAAQKDEGASKRTALDLALSITLQASARNRGNVLQVRAQGLIAEIVARPGIEEDPLVDALLAKAAAALESTGTGEQPGEVAYRRAEQLYAERDFGGALELFLQVPDSAPSYEKALVYQGVCRYEQGEPAAAAQVFDDYLNRYLREHRAPLDRLARAKRLEARATAKFYWGLAAAEQHDWQRVLDVLGGYADEFPEQAAFAPAAMYRVLVAEQHLEQEQAAAATYAKMLERYAKSSWTGRASTDLYQRLRAEREAARASDPARASELLREMARTLEVANGASSAPPFDNLRLLSRHWMELGEWASAEAVLLRIVARFASGAEAEAVRSYVLPDLGRAYYEQRELQQAADTLRPLFEGQAQPTAETARIFARCLAGWAELHQEGLKLEIVRVLGLAARPSDFERAVELYRQVADAEEKWTLPWLRLRFDGLYARLQWSELDSRQSEVLEQELLILKLELGLRFEDAPDPDLRELLTWLAAQVGA